MKKEEDKYNYYNLQYLFKIGDSLALKKINKRQSKGRPIVFSDLKGCKLKELNNE